MWICLMILYANLEKVQSDLMSFALETEDEKLKSSYEKDSVILKKVIEELKPYLLR